MTRQEYINTFSSVIKRVVKGTGIFPSVMMAQAILESSDKRGRPFNSTLARFWNNHFGIKADKSWKGKTVNLNTFEVYEGTKAAIFDLFRVYEHPVQSFEDRVAFLKKNKRYETAGVFRSTTPAEQADALKKAGYATHPEYHTILKKIIKRFSLDKLDQDYQ